MGAVIADCFRIDGVLGRGAGGTVYAATQTDLARPVALKVLNAILATSAKNVARFEREARALARIEDPGVVQVYAIGRTPDERPFLAMERVDGVPLEEIVREPLPVSRAIAIARRIASALSAVHAAGLVHRDLKPSNVMITRGDAIKLLDFGVVKLDDATKLTAGGEALGTPHYMAPEQATGEEQDARTDLYALGAILFRMITGSVPFEGTGMQVMMAHVGRPVPHVAHAGVDAVIARCMAKRASERYASAQELIAALDEVASSVVRRPSSGPRSAARSLEEIFSPLSEVHAPRARTHPIAYALGAMLVVAALAGMTRVAGPIARHLGPAPEIVDDGPRGDLFLGGEGYSMRVSVPRTLVAGHSADITLAIWDGDGAPLVGTETVVTIASPSGAVTGLRAAEPTPGIYRFRVHFAESGANVLRVFLPIGDATITIPLAVTRGVAAQA